MSAITVQGLVKRHRRREVVRDLSFEVPRGSIPAFLVMGAALATVFRRDVGFDPRGVGASSPVQDRSCAFGDGDPAAALDRLVTRADDDGVPVPGDLPLNGDDVMEAVSAALFDDADWPVLGCARPSRATGRRCSTSSRRSGRTGRPTRTTPTSRCSAPTRPPGPTRTPTPPATPS